MSETKTGGIAALMNTSIDELPQRKKAEPGRYEGVLKVATYDPANKNKVFLAFGDLVDTEDRGRPMVGYDNVMTSWTDDTPEAFLDDLNAFFRSHKNFRPGTAGVTLLPELVGKRYSFAVVQQKNKPEYTNVKNIRAVE